MDDTIQHKINRLLEHAELGQADGIRSLGSGVHNDGYYAKVGSREYCVHIARYEGKRGLIREADAIAAPEHDVVGEGEVTGDPGPKNEAMV